MSLQYANRALEHGSFVAAVGTAVFGFGVVDVAVGDGVGDVVGSARVDALANNTTILALLLWYSLAC